MDPEGAEAFLATWKVVCDEDGNVLFNGNKIVVQNKKSKQHVLFSMKGC